MHGRNPRHETNYANCADFPWFKNLNVNRKDLFNSLLRLRTIKTPEELQMMREVNRIAAEGPKFCMKKAAPGQYEYEIGNLFKVFCGWQGAPRLAYPAIVGAGANAATLHYHVNKAEVLNGQLVLCDMGCRLHGYCSDITTTWPVNGKFTPQ